MIIISNEFLTAYFSEKGAELKSLKCNKKEYIWNGDPAFWRESSPVLFPICSGLKDDEYIFQGKTYLMPNRHIMILLLWHFSELIEKIFYCCFSCSVGAEKCLVK